MSTLYLQKRSGDSEDLAIGSEGYLTVEGNAGDRNDLQAWHGGVCCIENKFGRLLTSIVGCTCGTSRGPQQEHDCGYQQRRPNQHGGLGQQP